MFRRSVLAGAGAASILGLSSLDAARADALDEAKKRGTLIVGTEAAYVPYEFFKDGKIVGYDPDIADLVASKIGVKAQFIDTAWSGIIPALYAGKFDCIISAMTITKERADKVLFSMPYADASNVVLLRADEQRIKAADDLSGKIIGVQLGSAAAGIIKAFEAKLKAAGKPGFQDVKQYEHYPEAYQDLLNKRTDSVVNSRSTLMVVTRDAPGKSQALVRRGAVRSACLNHVATCGAPAVARSAHVAEASGAQGAAGGRRYQHRRVRTGRLGGAGRGRDATGSRVRRNGAGQPLASRVAIGHASASRVRHAIFPRHAERLGAGCRVSPAGLLSALAAIMNPAARGMPFTRDRPGARAHRRPGRRPGR